VQNEHPSSSLQRHGLAQTRRSVQSLNHHVLSALLKEGINAVGISPGFYGPCQDDDHTVSLSLQKAVREALEAGLIPVLHGDGCLVVRQDSPLSSQQQRGTKDNGVMFQPAILSGDLLVQMLAGGFDRDDMKLGGIVFLTDVDGVYTSDPKRNENATLLPWIAVHREQDEESQPRLSFPALSKSIGDSSADKKRSSSLLQKGVQNSSHHHDVTGGLATKLKAAISIVHSTQQNVTVRQFGTARAAQELLSMNGNHNKRQEPQEGGTVLFWQGDILNSTTCDTPRTARTNE